MSRVDKGRQARRDFGLIDQAGVADVLADPTGRDEIWIEVIRKMDEVYSDLVHYQLELEEKNTALEEAQNFISSVLASMTDVLIVCDADGKVERANLAAELFTGRAEPLLRGDALADLFTADSAERINHFLACIRADKPVADEEISLIDHRGQPAPLSVNCSARYDHDGRLVGMVLIGRPVGELRRAYEDLDRTHQELTKTQRHLAFSEKMAALGRLVAGVAHELNNPISFVFGNMYALKNYGEHLKGYLQAMDDGADAETLREMRDAHKIDRILKDLTPLVDGTLEGAERVSEIVQDLRRFSSSQEEQPEALDVVKEIHTATRWVVKSARVKPEILFDMPDEMRILGRKGAINQIVVNLVQNAVDIVADVDDPTIEIACSRDSTDVWVRVRDNGPGVSEDDRGRVFEPFFTTKPIGEGTGLGLYVSYGLAEEQDGRLICENDADFGGAAFTLRLPYLGEC